MTCHYKGKHLCSDNDCELCFERSFASHYRSKYWSDKNKTSPRDYTKFSHTVHWFKCDICEHEFEIQLDLISYKNQWCTYCSNSKLCKDITCVDCYNKSFESSERKSSWSDKNDSLPREVFKGSKKIYLFECKECNHEFPRPLYHIRRGYWCPYCSSHKLCGKVECNFCFSKSVASLDISHYWSEKNELKAIQVSLSSHKKCIFLCNVCEHEFEIRIGHLTDANSWCPYCATNSGKLCDNEKCQFCFLLSFASNPKQSDWSRENEKRPRQVRKHSNQFFLFDCKRCGKTYKSKPASIKEFSCPYCKNKTELKLYTWLAENFKDLTIIVQAKFDWCRNKNNKQYMFDFYIENLNLVIELDGGQHFRQVKHWISPEKIMNLDVYKMIAIYRKNISVIRICQEDVWYDTCNWKAGLQPLIKQYDKPIVDYLSSKGIYEPHKITFNKYVNEDIKELAKILLYPEIEAKLEEIENLDGEIDENIENKSFTPSEPSTKPKPKYRLLSKVK